MKYTKEALVQLENIARQIPDSPITSFPERVETKLPNMIENLSIPFVETILRQVNGFTTLVAGTGIGKTYSVTNTNKAIPMLFCTPLNLIKAQTNMGMTYSSKSVLKAFKEGRFIRGTISPESLNMALDVLLKEEIEPFIAHIKNFILDEIHLYSTEGNYRSALPSLMQKLMFSRHANILGLTATPTLFEKKYSHIIEVQAKKVIDRNMFFCPIPVKPEGSKKGFRLTYIKKVLNDYINESDDDTMVIALIEDSLEYNELIDSDFVALNSIEKGKIDAEIAMYKALNENGQLNIDNINKLKEDFLIYELLYGNQTIDTKVLAASSIMTAGVNINNKVTKANFIIIPHEGTLTTMTTINQSIGRVRNATEINCLVLYDENTIKPRKNVELLKLLELDIAMGISKNLLSSFGQDTISIVNNNSSMIHKKAQLEIILNNNKTTVGMLSEEVEKTFNITPHFIKYEVTDEMLDTKTVFETTELIKGVVSNEAVYNKFIENIKDEVNLEWNQEESDKRAASFISTIGESIDVSTNLNNLSYKVMTKWSDHKQLFTDFGIICRPTISKVIVGMVRVRHLAYNKLTEAAMVEKLRDLPITPIRIDRANTSYFNEVIDIIPEPYSSYIKNTKNSTRIDILKHFILGKTTRADSEEYYYEFTPKGVLSYEEIMDKYTIEDKSVIRKDSVMVRDKNKNLVVIPQRFKNKREKSNGLYQVSAILQRGIKKANRVYFKNYEDHEMVEFSLIGKLMGEDITMNAFFYKNGRRLKNQSNKLTNTLFLDVDEGSEDIHTISNRLSELKVKYHISTTSDNNNLYKFHIALGLDKTIDEDTYRDTVQGFANKIKVKADDIATTNPIFCYNKALVLSGEGSDINSREYLNIGVSMKKLSKENKAKIKNKKTNNNQKTNKTLRDSHKDLPNISQSLKDSKPWNKDNISQYEENVIKNMLSANDGEGHIAILKAVSTLGHLGYRMDDLESYIEELIGKEWKSYDLNRLTGIFSSVRGYIGID